MPCDTVLKKGQTQAQRAAEVKKAVDRLKAAVETGQAKIKIGPQGAVTFEAQGLERDGITDACAFRRLVTENSWEFRKALATAETAAGRQVDQRMVAAGWHSHDGGATWGKH